jgi:SOS-response transcriptional repressor LexA
MGIFDKLFKREPSIKKLKERRNIKKLIEALGSDAKRIEQARDALVELSSRSVNQLIKALRGPNFLIRYHAAITLGEIGEKRALKPLLEALKDEFTGIGAAYAIGKITDDKEVEMIFSLYKKSERVVIEKKMGHERLKAVRKSLFSAAEKVAKKAL